MTQKMTPQEMTEELKKNPLYTMVFWGRMKNTVTVSYDETAETAAEVEANLTEMGFQASGYGMMRYDGQRIASQSDLTACEMEQSAARMRSATSHPSK